MQIQFFFQRTSSMEQIIILNVHILLIKSSLVLLSTEKCFIERVNTILCYTIMTKVYPSGNKQDTMCTTVERKQQIKLHCMIKMLYKALQLITRRYSESWSKGNLQRSCRNFAGTLNTGLFMWSLNGSW